MQPGGADLTALPPAQLSKLRVLWAFMRMWMEWTYAWQRWNEFHTVPVQKPVQKNSKH